MKPSPSVWTRVSIFVYERDGDICTILNEAPTTNNHLFYSGLVVKGSVNRAGTSKFTVTNVGTATDDERSLFDDQESAEGTSTRQKYIAIFCKTDLIWSGKILRSIKVVQPLYTSTATFCQWEVECESDIGKMKLQAVNVPSPASITGTIGEISTYLLKNKELSDIDWTGYVPLSSPPKWRSVISNEGAKFNYKISDSDMYTQLMSIVNISGFEWRTRLVNWIGTGTWDGATILGDAGLTAEFLSSELIGRHVIFLPDTGYIKSYGRISGLVDIMDIQYTPGTMLFELGAQYWFSQSIVPTVPGISKVTIPLKKLGVPTGDLTVTIEGDSGNLPDGVPLATDTIDVSTLTTTLTDHDFSLSCNVIPGTKYWVVLKGQAAWEVLVDTVYIQMKSSGSSSIYRSYGVGAWTSRDNTYSMILATYYSSVSLTNIVNPTLPAATGNFAVLFDPVIDLCWDLEEPVPVQTYLVNSPVNTYNFFCYNYNDVTDKKQIATKVTVKGKDVSSSKSESGTSDSISTTLYAVNKWEPEAVMFENCSIVTQRMDGYIESCIPTSWTIDLIGRGYALQHDDIFDVYARYTDGTYAFETGFIVDTVTETEVNGIKTTTILCQAQVGHATKTMSKYSVLSARKVYVQDPTRLYTAPANVTIYFGGSSESGVPINKSITSEGTDTALGYWISGSTYYPTVNDVRPIFPGCLASSVRGDETPRPGSPMALFGVVSSIDTVDQAVTMGDLEVYVTQALMNHSFYLRKGSFTCIINDFLKPGDRSISQLYDWMFVKEGDRIAVAPTSEIGVSHLLDKTFDNQYKYLWEVISWSFDTDKMEITVELGDYEPNVNSLITSKTLSLNSTIT